MNREMFQNARAAQAMVVLSVVGGVLVALATIVQMTLLSRIVARVFLAHQGLPRVAPLLLALLAAVSARAVLVFCRTLCGEWAAIRVTAALRARLVAHLLRLGPAYSAGERTGEL